MSVSVAPRRSVKAAAPSHAKGEDACLVRIRARLVSLNGGVMLMVCALFTAFAIGAALSHRGVAIEVVLFGLLALAAWTYLLDASTERLELNHGAIERTSLLGSRVSIRVDDLQELLLIHEGLNSNVGIESVTARYQNGREERLPLGPCWRRRDLEGFLASVEAMRGNQKLLEEVR